MNFINDPKIVGGGRLGETFSNEIRNDGYMIDSAKNFDSTIDFILGDMRVLMKNPYSRSGSIKGRLTNWGQPEYSANIKSIMNGYYLRFMPAFKDLFKKFYDVMVFIDKQKNETTLKEKIDIFLKNIDEFKKKLDDQINNNSFGNNISSELNINPAKTYNHSQQNQYANNYNQKNISIAQPIAQEIDQSQYQQQPQYIQQQYGQYNQGSGGKRHRKNQTRRHTNRRKRSQRHH